MATGMTERGGIVTGIRATKVAEIAPGIGRENGSGEKKESIAAAPGHRMRKLDDHDPEKKRSEEIGTSTEIETEAAGGRGAERNTAESDGRDPQMPAHHVAKETTTPLSNVTVRCHHRMTLLPSVTEMSP